MIGTTPGEIMERRETTIKIADIEIIRQRRGKVKEENIVKDYVEKIMKRLKTIEEDFEVTKDYLDTYGRIDEITTANHVLWGCQIIDTETYEEIANRASRLRQHIETEDFCDGDDELGW